jgi:hypothetical protein
VSAAELGRHSFAAGSMGPKVAAACRFAAGTGKKAAIGALADLGRNTDRPGPPPAAAARRMGRNAGPGPNHDDRRIR